MSEMSKSIKILLVISIFSILLSGFTLIYAFVAIQNQPISGSSSLSTYYYISGTYSGDIIFNNTAYVRDSDTAVLRDGNIMGEEIIIYGNLTLQNVTVNQDITVRGNGSLTILDVVLRTGVKLIVEEMGNINANNLQNYANVSLTQLYAYDNSTIIMNNSILKANFYEYSILNATNLKTWAEFDTKLYFYEHSQATILNSTLDQTYVGYGVDQNPVFSKIILNNSYTRVGSAYSYGIYYILNGTTINTYWGYENSIIYNSSSTINTLNLAGAAQKIDI